VNPCRTTGYHPHPYAHVNSYDWPVRRREIQLTIASQATEYELRSECNVLCALELVFWSATVMKSDEARIRPWITGLLSCPRQVAAVICRTIGHGSLGRRAVVRLLLLSAGCPAADRRAISLSPSGRCRPSRHSVTSRRVAAAGCWAVRVGTPLSSLGRPVVDRRAVGLPRWDATVSRCHIVPPSAVLHQLLFHFSYLSFLQTFCCPLFELLIVIVVNCLDYTLFQLYT